MQISNLELSKDMKYEALYWALGFEELERNIFSKNYGSFVAKIYADKQYVDYNDKLSIVNGDRLMLDTHKSFVVLECIDKLLSMLTDTAHYARLVLERRIRSIFPQLDGCC